MNGPKTVRTAVVTVLAGVAFWLTLVMNGQYIKQTFFPTKFFFGKAEMFTMLGTLNRTKTWEFVDRGHRYALEINLHAQTGVDVERRITSAHPLASRAYACASRNFFQTASACLDTTTLDVVGTATLHERQPVAATLIDHGAATGSLTVVGTSIGRVRLGLRVGEGYAELKSPDGRAFEISHVRLPQVVQNGGILQFVR